MKKLLATVSVTVILTGCTISNVNEVGDGQYMVKMHGNAFHSNETLLNDIKEKASKLCGHNNFTLEGPDSLKTNKVKYYDGTRNQTSTSVTLIKIVNCKKA